MAFTHLNYCRNANRSDPDEQIHRLDHGREIPPLGSFSLVRKMSRYRTDELEAVHGGAAYIQHCPVRLGICRPFAPAGAEDVKRDVADVRKEIDQILQANASAPFGGLAGEKFVNVLEVNLELCKRYGVPK